MMLHGLQRTLLVPRAVARDSCTATSLMHRLLYVSAHVTRTLLQLIHAPVLVKGISVVVTKSGWMWYDLHESTAFLLVC